MEKVLSIIIPTYNMESYLHRCLDSLLVGENQDCVEVLVINDGSKDSSSSIAHEYQDRFPDSFRVIDKENGNYGSCINRGLKEAKGKYVKILDADDHFDTEVFVQYLNTISRVDADLIVSDFTTVNESDGKETRYEGHFVANKLISFSEFESSVYNPHIAMHMVAYRTENLRKIDYTQTEGISYTDQEWIFRPMTTVESVYYIPIPLYRYLVGREGQTMSAANWAKSIKPHIQIVDKMLSQLSEFRQTRYENYLCSRISFVSSLIYHCVLFGNDSTQLGVLDHFDAQLLDAAKDVHGELETTAEKVFCFTYHYLSSWRSQKNRLRFSLCNKMAKKAINMSQAIQRMAKKQ